MYLYWQRHSLPGAEVYADIGEHGLPYYWAVYLAESVREKGKMPRRRIITYLGCVNPLALDYGMNPSLVNTYIVMPDGCKLRCTFWTGVERRLMKAETAGNMSREDHLRFAAELAEVVPRPPDDHDRGAGQWACGCGWRTCDITPVRLPDRVLAATQRWEEKQR